MLDDTTQPTSEKALPAESTPTSDSPANTNGALNTAALELYKLAVNEIGRVENNRANADNVYRSVATLLLGGETWVAVNSQLQSWMPVFIASSIALFGLFFTSVWRYGMDQSSREVQFLHDYVHHLEKRPGLESAGLNLYTAIYGWIAGDEPYVNITPRRHQRGLLHIHMPALFRTAMIEIALLLALATFLAPQLAFQGIITPLVPAAVPTSTPVGGGFGS